MPFDSDKETEPSVERLAFQFPWPAERPMVEVPTEPAGWLADGARAILAEELSGDTAIVLELGAWLGLSTRYIADLAPNAIVITVDTWLGSQEHREDARCAPLLPTLHSAFLKACWEYRSRIIPLKMTTLEGIERVATHGLAPDLVYLDAEQTCEAVLAELYVCHECFPHTILTGDDYSAPDVRKAVDEFALANSFKVKVKGGWPAWRLRES
jgi:hypothetical protein